MSDSKHKVKDANILCQKNLRRFSCVKAHHLFVGGGGGGGGKQKMAVFVVHRLYFFGYKTEFFSFQYYPRNLNPSHKMDLDLWDS